jgi:hypothetical protein
MLHCKNAENADCANEKAWIPYKDPHPYVVHFGTNSATRSKRFN